jgi:formamidopyrimidine-DNA glycosylase
MPELPDVERTRRDLKRWLVGAIVTAADTEDARLSRPTSPRAFARAVVGRTFERVERRGKWLRLDLDDGAKVFSHLGMTGDWVRVAIGALTARFERAGIDVVLRGRAFSMRYVGARRLGRPLAVRKDVAVWTALGPDPFADGIDMGRFSEVLARAARGEGDRHGPARLCGYRQHLGDGGLVDGAHRSAIPRQRAAPSR